MPSDEYERDAFARMIRDEVIFGNALEGELGDDDTDFLAMAQSWADAILSSPAMQAHDRALIEAERERWVTAAREALAIDTVEYDKERIIDGMRRVLLAAICAEPGDAEPWADPEPMSGHYGRHEQNEECEERGCVYRPRTRQQYDAETGGAP